MKENKDILTEKELKDCENAAIIDVPDDVFVSNSGKCYYPEYSKKAPVKISLEDADAKGYKPSKAYTAFVSKLYEEQKEQDK